DQRLGGPQCLDQAAAGQRPAVPHEGEHRTTGRVVEVGAGGDDGGHTSSFARTAGVVPRAVRVWKTSSRLGSCRARSVTSMPAPARAAAIPVRTPSPATGTDAAPGREATPLSVEALVPGAATASSSAITS